MLEFLTQNAPAIVAVLLAVFVVVDKVVALTPSKKDDEIVAKVESVVKPILDAISGDKSKPSA